MRNQLAVLGILFDGQERSTRQIAAEFNGLARSSAYAALAMLQKNGYISARWDVESDPQPTRRYEITAKGKMAYVSETKQVPTVHRGRSAEAFIVVGPYLLFGSLVDMIGATVAGLIVTFFVGLILAVSGRSIANCWAAHLTRQLPNSTDAVYDFVEAHFSFATTPSSVLGTLRLLWQMRDIAQIQDRAESDPLTSTRTAPNPHDSPPETVFSRIIEERSWMPVDPLGREVEREVPLVPMPRWKRRFDVAISLISLITLAPFFTLVSFGLVLANRQSPVCFRERVGQGGKIFLVPAFRLTKGGRETGVGTLLRRTRVTDFGYFWNILRGDMSLIGPYPATVSAVDTYRSADFARLAVPPGVTGLWQVTQGIQDFDDMVSLDVRYARNLSARLDLQILLRSAFVGAKITLMELKGALPRRML